MDGAEQGGRVATRDVFTDEELDQLRRFPDISREELIRYFTLTPADEAFVVARHGAANRLGAAVQLCSLPWLGFVPDDVVSAPPVAVARLSERLRFPVGELVDYGSREQTRTDHLREVARYLGWRLAEEFQWRELDVSDQHSTYGTKVIAATAPESHYVLDEILGNATDLPIAEHATDTHGASLANFALFDLVGKQLSPRIRDLGGIT